MDKRLQYAICILLLIMLPVVLLLGLPHRSARPEYGKATMLYDPIEEVPNPFRKIAWLDGKWEFRLPTDEVWHKVAVPHVWNSIPGLENYVGQAEYRIKFNLPKEWKSDVVRVHFGAVAGRAEVYFNGKPVAENTSRFLPFDVDITGLVHRSAKNELLVRVDNRPGAHGTPYFLDEKNYGGIYREVYLEQSRNIRIEDVAIDTQPLGNGTASVHVKALLTMPTGGVAHVFANISPEKGLKILSYDTDISAGDNGQYIFDWQAELPNASLWEPEKRTKYQLSMVVITKEGETDGIERTFGIRKFEIRGDGFYLNGDRVKIRGVVWREQFPFGWGPMVTPEFLESDLERIRLAGFNAVRLTHPVHPAFLDACDKAGLLVFEELPLWKRFVGGNDPDGSLDKLEDEMNRMVERDRRHPSIVAWGLGREIDARDPDTSAVVGRLRDNLKRLDPDRLVYGGERGLRGPALEGMDFNAFTAYPGWTDGSPERFGNELKSGDFAMRKKGLLAIGVGAGAVPGRTGGANVKGTELNQLYVLSAVEKALKDNDDVAGWFVDGFNDYEGAWVDPRGRANTVNTGIFSTAREPKTAFHWFAGIGEDEIEWKLSRFPLHIPAADLTALIFFLIAGMTIWSGFSKMWPAFIEPDGLRDVENDWREMARSFAFFGLPMLLIAGAAASFAVAGRMGAHPLDPVLIPIGAVRAANVWLNPFIMRFFTLVFLQIAMLVCVALLMSPFLDGEPLRIFELLSRCTALRLLFFLIPFIPVSPWIIVLLVLGWETYMQSESITKKYEITPGWAAVIAGSAQAAVLLLALGAVYLCFGSIAFLF